jgi:hypothetical protein
VTSSESPFFYKRNVQFIHKNLKILRACALFVERRDLNKLVHELSVIYRAQSSLELLDKYFRSLLNQSLRQVLISKTLH